MQLLFSVLLLALLFPALFLPVDLQAQSAQLPPGTSAPDQQDQSPQTQASPLTQPEAAIEAKDYEKARGLIDAYLSAHPGDARALFDHGYCDDAQGKTQAAEKYYRKAIVSDPKQFEARLALGLLLAQQGSEEEAQTQIEMAVTLEPNPPSPAAKAQAYRALARLVHESDPDAAKQALLEALKLSPETVSDT